jgi:aryl-alcohol dehydrogenase-like predicted oxidoreductase
MSRLALGSVQFGLSYGIANQNGQVSSLNIKKMLHLAKAQGIDTIDTAIDYGESEASLGEVGVHGFKLVTKLPTVPNDCVNVNEWIHEQIKQSLIRLGVSSVYGLLLHRSEELVGKHGKEIYKTLQDLKDLGQVEKVGVSIYSPSELDVLALKYKLDLVQAPFNLVDRRLQTSGWLNRLKNEGTEIHTRSAFLQGLLLMSRAAVPEKFMPWSEIWNKWQEWLTSEQISAIQACLDFPLAFPEIDRIVVGAENVAQLEQIIKAEVSSSQVEFPNLSCEEENLINPSQWSRL